MASLYPDFEDQIPERMEPDYIDSAFYAVKNPGKLLYMPGRIVYSLEKNVFK